MLEVFGMQIVKLSVSTAVVGYSHLILRLIAVCRINQIRAVKTFAEFVVET